MNRRTQAFFARLAMLLVAAGLGMGAGWLWRHRIAREALRSAREQTIGASPDAKRGHVNVQAAAFHKFDDSPLASQLERDLARSSGVTRWLCWLAALEKATPSDFPRLAKLAQNNPAALKFVAARWAVLAPRHMFESLIAAAQGHGDLPLQSLAHVLFSEWPKRDQEGAIAALSQPGVVGMQWAWQMDAATAVINSDVERGLRLFSEWHIENYMPFADDRGPVPKWAAADPRHAAEYALQYPSAYLSEGVIKVIGEEWAKTDPRDALEFSAGRRGQLGTLLGSAAMTAWAEADLNAAADWLADAADPTLNRLSPGLAQAWAKKDPASALAWCNENLQGSPLSRAVAAIVEGAGPSQVTMTAALIADMAPSPARTEGALAVAQQWFPSLGGMAGPSGAVTVGGETTDWLASLDPVSLERVLDKESWGWATSDPRSMADFLLSRTNEVAGSWPDTCLARQLARQNPTAALDWAGQLSGARGLAAGAEAFAAWRISQPDAASLWLGNLPPEDPRRQPFFQSAIRQLAYAPQAPEQLAALTSDERALARPVIENMTSLPADRRGRLLASLAGP
jgi:hypothetical protein